MKEYGKLNHDEKFEVLKSWSISVYLTTGFVIVLILILFLFGASLVYNKYQFLKTHFDILQNIVQ